MLKLLAKTSRLFGKTVSFLAVWMMLVLIFTGGYFVYDSFLLKKQGEAADLKTYRPQSGSLSLKELKKINPDVCGWITLDGTAIDQPVVAGDDDMEYINKDAKGDFSLAGSIFVSSLNASDFSDPCTLIYGHHMEDHGMFTDLDLYLNPQFFEKNQAGTLTILSESSPDSDASDADAQLDTDVSASKTGRSDPAEPEYSETSVTLRVFAVLETGADNNTVYLPIQYQKNTENLVEYLKDNALSYRPVLSKDHKILELSTCQEEKTNDRLIVFAELLD